MASTPEMNVVPTAPIPGSRMPSLPVGGVMSTLRARVTQISDGETAGAIGAIIARLTRKRVPFCKGGTVLDGVVARGPADHEWS